MGLQCGTTRLRSNTPKSRLRRLALPIPKTREPSWRRSMTISPSRVMDRLDFGTSTGVFSARRALLECTMSKLMGGTGGTWLQGRAMDLVSQIRRTKAS